MSMKEDTPIATNLTPVTVIGLGKMGSALANAFVDRGHPTTVWNRTPEKAAPLVENGATHAPTVQAAVSANPVVIICVLDYAAAHEVLEPVGESLSDRVLVNLTNGTPEQARSMADWADEIGTTYLDGGIMAVPPMIGTPESLVLYSGAKAAFETHLPALEALGAATYLGVDAGSAALYDLALLSAMYGMFGGYFHAVSLASDTDPVEFTTELVIPWLNGMTEALVPMATAIANGDHATDGSTLAMQAVGIQNIVDASTAEGVSPAVLSPMQELVDRGVDAGHGDDGLSRLVEVINQ